MSADRKSRMQERKKKTIAAVVSGKSGSKSIKVTIDYKVKHPKYGKYMRRQTTLNVHDELNQAGLGDTVEVCESRPYSKTKSWRVVNVLHKAASQ
jgi:small subunit ribosomal protein S17